MGKYKGTIYLNKTTRNLITDVLDRKVGKYMCKNQKDLTFSVQLEWFGDNAKDKPANNNDVFATARIILPNKSKSTLQIAGFVCNPITMSETLVSLKKYRSIYGEHKIVINGRDAVVDIRES